MEPIPFAFMATVTLLLVAAGFIVTILDVSALFVSIMFMAVITAMVEYYIRSRDRT